MLRVHPIQSPDEPALEPYRTLGRPEEHRRKGIFVAAGEKVVRRLLHSGFTVVSLLITPEWLQALEPLWRTREEEMTAYVGTRELLETIIGHSMYQGLMAVARVPPQPSLQEILKRSARPWLLLALDGINNAENLGTLLRNGAGFGVQAVLVGETASSPYLRRAVRTSMGAVFHLPIVELTSLVDALRLLRASGVRCVAAHLSPTSKPLTAVDLAADVCLVFGHEDEGISAPVLEACDSAAVIPMHSSVDSLNVANAAAVLLYEANRQRGRYD